MSAGHRRELARVRLCSGRSACKLASSTDPDLVTTAYEYNREGRLNKITEPLPLPLDPLTGVRRKRVTSITEEVMSDSELGICTKVTKQLNGPSGPVLPSDLPVIEEVLLPGPVKACPVAWRRIGEERSDSLDYQSGKVSSAASSCPPTSLSPTATRLR